MDSKTWSVKRTIDSIILWNPPNGLHVFDKGHIRTGPNFCSNYYPGEDYE